MSQSLALISATASPGQSMSTMVMPTANAAADSVVGAAAVLPGAMLGWAARAPCTDASRRWGALVLMALGVVLALVVDGWGRRHSPAPGTIGYVVE
ncbi:hypothetical protein, partial [Pseudonocardia abyssalis]